MSDIHIEVVADNSEEFKRKMKEGVEAALEAVGNQAVSHSKNIVTAKVPRSPESWYNLTGNLRNSISHEVKMSDDAVYIGTNVEYAVYNEYGTGVYADTGKTTGWWVFVPGSGTGNGSRSGKRYSEKEARKIVAAMRAKGIDAHMTQGMKPIHFIRDAVQGHEKEYESIIISEIKKKLE